MKEDVTIPIQVTRNRFHMSIREIHLHIWKVEIVPIPGAPLPILFGYACKGCVACSASALGREPFPVHNLGKASPSLSCCILYTARGSSQENMQHHKGVSFPKTTAATLGFNETITLTLGGRWNTLGLEGGTLKGPIAVYR